MHKDIHEKVMHDGIPFVKMVEPRKLLRNYAYHLKLFM